MFINDQYHQHLHHHIVNKRLVFKKEIDFEIIFHLCSMKFFIIYSIKCCLIIQEVKDVSQYFIRIIYFLCSQIKISFEFNCLPINLFIEQGERKKFFYPGDFSKSIHY